MSGADLGPAANAERDRQRVQLLLNARLTYGRTPAPQKDAGHLPLFIAANEPALL